MNQLNLDTKLTIVAVGTFLIAYILTFPMGWLVSDEYSYLNQGIAIAKGEIILTYTDAISDQNIPYKWTSYPLGNAFWIALWVKIFGMKFAYIGSLMSVILSVLLIYKILVKESFYKLSILLFFIYPPLVFFSKSFMSSMPSLLVVSVFFYLLFHWKESGRKWLLLSFIAALSFWIRETNIVFLGSICLVHFLKDRRWLLYYASGTIIGFLPRMISSHYFYGDPFHYVLAESFSFGNLITNAGVYGILLLCFMPLGLFFIKTYRGRYFMPLLISALLFIFMYLFYSFNSTIYSGFSKGVILMGRFMIPILPLFIISVGWYFKQMSNQKLFKVLETPVFKYVITILVSFLIMGMQFLVYKEAKVHKEISNHIYDQYANKMVMYDLSRTTNIIRYINPFHGVLEYSSDISNLEEDDFMNKLFSKFDDAYLIQTLNTVNSDKENYTSSINKMVKNANKSYTLEEMERIKIKPSLYLQIVKIQAKDGQEK